MSWEGGLGDKTLKPIDGWFVEKEEKDENIPNMHYWDYGNAKIVKSKRKTRTSLSVLYLAKS